MKCPACRRPLRSTALGDVTLDACHGGCGGIWFDGGELKLDPPAAELQQWLDDLAASKTVSVDLSPRRRCPRCPDSVLMRHFSSASRAVTIDECPTCAGVWLDSGELEKIRSEHVSAEDRSRAVVRLFEEGAIDERMALIAQQLGEEAPCSSWRSRVASGVVVALYLVYGIRVSAVPTVVRWCVLPLACIWFPGFLGRPAGRGIRLGARVIRVWPRNLGAPQALIWFLGWFVLLLPVIAAAIALGLGRDGLL
jgi:uncharacterized protein